MRKSFYLPKDNLGKAIWLNNFASKFAVVAPAFGFTPADITAVNGYAAMFNYLINTVETLIAAKENFVKYKSIIRNNAIGSSTGVFPALPVLPAAPAAVPAGIFLIVAHIVQRIKNHPDYTDALGRDLGIIGAEQTIDTSTMKPVLKLVFEGGVWEVQWKKENADAVRIESDNDGTGFKFLAIDSVPHYTDTTPITAAGTRKYRAMYIINDELVGAWSDVVSITVG